MTARRGCSTLGHVSAGGVLYRGIEQGQEAQEAGDLVEARMPVKRIEPPNVRLFSEQEARKTQRRSRGRLAGQFAIRPEDVGRDLFDPSGRQLLRSRRMNDG